MLLNLSEPQIEQAWLKKQTILGQRLLNMPIVYSSSLTDEISLGPAADVN